MAAVGRLPLLLLSLLVFTLLTYGFPQPRLSPLHRGSSPADEAQRKLLYPSVSLRDWSLQMMSDFGAAESQTEVLGEEWFSSNPDLWASNPGLWASNPGLWASNSGQEKRNIVVADDAAFREKSKLLTAMERQKWLNSYMQKLLVVNSQ